MLYCIKYLKNGVERELKIKARNKEELQNKINRLNIVPLHISQSELKPKNNIFLKNKPSLKEQIAAFYQLKLGFMAQIPLQNILENICKSTKNATLKAQFEKAKEGILLGENFGECFKKAQFSNFICAILEAAYKSGEMVKNLNFLILLLKTQNQNRKNALKLMLYPLFVILIMFCVMIGITLFVLPQFSSLFASMGADLPLITRLLLFTSSFIMSYYFLIILFLFIFLIIFFALLKNEKFRYFWDKIILKIPLFGEALKYQQTSLFLMILKTLHENSVSLKNSFEIASSAVDNSFLRFNLKLIFLNIANGLNISESFKRSGLWDNLSLQIFSGFGNNDESFLEAINAAFELHKEEYEEKTALALKALEPISIVFLGLCALILALGIFLPLWELPMQMR